MHSLLTKKSFLLTINKKSLKQEAFLLIQDTLTNISISIQTKSWNFDA